MRQAYVRALLLPLLAILACARAPRTSLLSEGCPVPRGKPLAVIDASQRAMLVGSFRLVQINSSDRRDAPSERVTPIRLRLAGTTDQANARAKTLGNRPRNVDMIGTRDFEKYGYVDRIELDSAVLFVGCRECLDASPDILVIRGISASGFTGVWANQQSGISRIVRRDGSFAPNPGGHFCATRVQPEAD